MKKILVPTDFSEIAANAYRFAQRLVAEGGGEIILMHAHHPSFDYANPYLDIPAQEFQHVKQDLMNNFVEENTNKGAGEDGSAVVTLPKIDMKLGFAAEEIIRASEEVSLIVMGTTGEGNLFEKAFGSVSTSVASHAHCPVLLIPGKCACEGFSNIVYASSNEAADKVMASQLTNLIKSAPATVHFLHVNKDENAGEDYRIQQAAFEKTLDGQTPGIRFNSVSIRCDDIQKGIVQYAEDIKADLVVTATTHRSFLERLFHKSVTREVVFHTTIPLMVLHYDQ
jgi:nucleotide-binding universal stress UspA family protein